MKKALTLERNKRVWELDFLRGLSILLVVWDHAMYDFARVFSSWATGPSDFLRSTYRFAHEYIYDHHEYLSYTQMKDLLVKMLKHIFE